MSGIVHDQIKNCLNNRNLKLAGETRKQNMLKFLIITLLENSVPDNFYQFSFFLPLLLVFVTFSFLTSIAAFLVFAFFTLSALLNNPLIPS
jgi:hypothetical protein